MNEVLLIHRIDTEKVNEEKMHRLNFIVGGMSEELGDEILEILSQMDFINHSHVVLKYNGFVVEVVAKRIPELIKQVAIHDIPLYEIYELYDSE